MKQIGSKELLYAIVTISEFRLAIIGSPITNQVSGKCLFGYILFLGGVVLVIDYNCGNRCKT